MPCHWFATMSWLLVSRMKIMVKMGRTKEMMMLRMKGMLQTKRMMVMKRMLVMARRMLKKLLVRTKMGV